MRVKDRLYVGALVVLASIVLGQFASNEVHKPAPNGTVHIASVAQAQDKKPDPSPEQIKKGIEDLREKAQAFKRGAKPTPAAKVFAAKKFSPAGIHALPQVAYVPKKMSVWGNNQYGDCVSAEEAFNQAACGAFMEDATVIGWARKHGYLNGADLLEVMQSMAKDGMHQDGKVYGVGTSPTTVDFSSDSALQAALSIAPIKLGMDANALPSGAGQKQGWYKFGGRPGQYNSEDHSTSLCGYGPASFCFKAVGVDLPSGVEPTKPCYLHFTWGTIGVVDHDWVMSCVSEAWLRNPTQTIDGKPQPNPGPVQTVPSITSPLTAAATTGALFSYQITASNSPSQWAAAGLPDGVSCAASTGLITGIPKAAGSFSVTLSASNGSGTGTATLALTVTGAPVPPGPGPAPVPSNVRVTLSADQILALQRDPTNTLIPTTAQVQDIINQSGLEVIDGKMTLVEFQAAVARAASKQSQYKTPPPRPTVTTEDRMDRLEKAFMQLMDRLDKK